MRAPGAQALSERLGQADEVGKGRETRDFERHPPRRTIEVPAKSHCQQVLILLFLDCLVVVVFPFLCCSYEFLKLPSCSTYGTYDKKFSMNWLERQSPGNRCSEHHCPFSLTSR